MIKIKEVGTVDVGLAYSVTVDCSYTSRLSNYSLLLTVAGT